MSTQPDNILLSFTNVDTLSTDGGRSNDTHYYYKEGQVYIDGQENIPEFKRLNLSNDQLSKTTMVRIPEGSGIYTSPDGFDINCADGDMVLAVHNYTGNDDLNDISKFSSDSWWYDITLHKMYRVYLRVGYTETEIRGGETLYNWKVKEVRKVYRTHNEDDKSGVYTFPKIPTEDIGITASVRVDKYSTGNVWETVKLNLYYNDSLLGSETLDTTVTSLPTTMNLLIDRAKEDVKINDELKMSVEVDGAIGTDSLLITEYTMSVSSETNVDAPETILGFSENLGLERDFDCQPTLNNTMVARQSEFIQDVDYSISSEGSGSVTPQNLSQILSNQATKATVPDSNYTQYSSIIPKYYGSKTNRTGINLSSSIASNNGLVDNSTESDLNLSPFYFTTDNLGSFPNVESKNTYLGYFEKIVDPYPLLNNKTAYYVKYLVDKNTDVQDPSLSVQGLNNLKNTFKTNDVNSLPTSVKASVQNIDEARELKDLETLSTVYSVGKYPTTVLYSQTSSIGHSNTITLSGSSNEFLSSFDGTDQDYKNLAFTANETIVGTSLSTNTSRETSLEEDLGEVLKPSNISFIPPANQEAYTNSTGIITVNDELTDEYTLTVDYNFFTSHLPPQMYYSTISKSYWGKVQFVAETKTGGRLKFKEVDVRLLQWSNSTKVGEGSVNEVALQTNKIYSYLVDKNSATSNNFLINKLSSGIVEINFDSHQIYTALNGEGYLKNPNNSDAYNNWSSKTSTNAEREAEIDKLRSDKGNYLEWKVRLKFKLQDPTINYATNVTTPATVKIKRFGELEQENYDNLLNPAYGASNNKADRFFTSGVYTSTTSNTTNFKRTFNPFGVENSNRDNVRFDLRGNKTPPPEALGVAYAPFWSFLPSSPAKNKIYLVNSLLNRNYSFNYYQADLKYTPDRSTDFPFSKEPSFTRIPSATNPWEIRVDDEFRFENLETKSFKVKSIITRTIDGEERLEVTFDRNIPNGTNLNFFIIRRFKSSSNFVILNQQKPYGVPPSASSAPGILQTQYQSEELENNPDKVITNLIERNLI